MSNVYRISQPDFFICKKREVRWKQVGNHILAGYNSGIYPKNSFYYDTAETDIHKQLPVRVVMVGESESKGNWLRRRENSDTFSLEMVVEGSFEFCQENNFYRVPAGGLFIVHANRSSMMQTTRGKYAKKLSVILKGPMLAKILEMLKLDNTDTVSLEQHRQEFENIFLNLAGELKNKLPGYVLRSSEMAYGLLIKIAAEAALAEGNQDELQPILEYIENHLDEKISISRLVTEFNLSASTIHRLFKQHSGDSPTNYIIKKRMQHAENLLRLSDISIKEIAVMTGYSNQHFFSSEFRKYAGVSPSQFREQYRIADVSRP